VFDRLLDAKKEDFFSSLFGPENLGDLSELDNRDVPIARIFGRVTGPNFFFIRFCGPILKERTLWGFLLLHIDEDWQTPEMVPRGQ